MSQPVSVVGLEPLNTASRTQKSADSILRFIRDQHLAIGDKLPPEAALAGSLGVGRKTVREALSALQAVGAVESRMGSGWFVTNGTAEAAARAFTVALPWNVQASLDVVQLRIPLECGLLGVSMRLMSTEHKAVLLEMASEMMQLARSGHSTVELVDLDRRFHQTLFAPLDNSVLPILFDLLFHLNHLSRELLSFDDNRRVEIAQHHVDLANAVAQGDVELATRLLKLQFEAGVKWVKARVESPS